MYKHQKQRPNKIIVEYITVLQMEEIRKANFLSITFKEGETIKKRHKFDYINYLNFHIHKNKN